MGCYGFIRPIRGPGWETARSRLGCLPPALCETVAAFLPPRVTRGPAAWSARGRASGWVVEVPLTLERASRAAPERVLRTIAAAARVAAAQGASVAGTAMAARLVRAHAGALALRAGIPVVTGSGYALAVTVRSLEIAARLAGLDLRTATVAVTGLPSPEAEVCARLLARSCSRLVLASRPGHALAALAVSIMESTGLSPRIVSGETGRFPESDVVVAAGGAEVPPGAVRPGGVICRLGATAACAEMKGPPDVVLMDGGLVRSPGGHCGRGAADSGTISEGELLEPSLAAVIMLAMESLASAAEIARLEGRVPSEAEADEMGRIAARHGFETAGPAWRGRLVCVGRSAALA